MDWLQFLVFTVTMAGLFFWQRGESRADFRYIDMKLDEHRKEVNALLKAIQEEMKDFHNRLCKIEAERK